MAEYTYNTSNQMLRATEYHGKKRSVILYCYDKDGNRVAKTGRLGKKQVDISYLYSVENRLKAVYNGKELLMAAAYDGDGNRIFQLNNHEKDDYGRQNRSGILFPIPQKTGGLEQELMGLIKTPENEKNYELIEYVNDINREHAEVLMELNVNGKIEHAYSYGLNRLSSDHFTREVSYYHYDPRGSVTGITDENAVLWQSYRYEPFGNLSYGKPKFSNVYAYNGESYNPNTESQYLRSRYYDTTLGNFYSEDQYLGNVLDPMSLNRYNYGKSSPLNYKDPSGHMPLYLQFNVLSAAMLQTISPPAAASSMTEKLSLNLDPQLGSFTNSLVGRKNIQNLSIQVSNLANQYVNETDVQKRENTLKSLVDKVGKMCIALCGKPKKKIEPLTKYWQDLNKLLERYKGSGQIADKYFASERLKIRATPNGQQIDGNRVFTSGAIVKIHESKETQKVDGSDSTWIKIYYDVNKIGWVGKELLEELPQPVTGHNFNYNWDKSQYVSQDFKDKAAGVAKSLGIDPDDLMAIMAFESYFNPAQKNMGGGSATGLVQFMPDTAQELHTTTTELAAMTGVEQLDYVYGYFYPYKGRLVTLSDIYMRVLWPSGIGKSEEEAIFNKGDSRYEPNSGLDINLDGKITKKEATQKVIDERNKY